MPMSNTFALTGSSYQDKDTVRFLDDSSDPLAKRSVTNLVVGNEMFVIPQRLPSRTPEQAGIELETVPLPFDEEPRKVVRLPRLPKSREVFTLLQQWEGTVELKKETEFTARIYDLTNPQLSEEQVSISLDEVPDPDIELVVPGAIFYWTIGYETTLTGTRKTVSLIRFRRLPAWSRKDIERIKTEKERILRILDSFDTKPPTALP